jgi:hypothetical protein
VSRAEPSTPAIACGPRRSPRLLAAIACAAAITLGSAAASAAAPPDAHDRALVAALNAKVTVFRAVASESGSSTNDELDRCPYIKQHPDQAFAAAFSMLPALLIEVVNRFKPELTGLRTTLAAMHPDSTVFAQWLSAEHAELGLILEFDNHGRSIDLCNAVTVLLAKHTTAADVRRALGIDPSLIAVLFSSASQKSSGVLAKLGPTMRTFFVAAGLSKASAAALTSAS